MKPFILTVALFCLCNINSFSQSKIFRPQKIREYHWDSQNTLWNEQRSTQYKYNNYGDILEETTRDIYRDNVYKTVRTVSNTHKPISETAYIYDSLNSKWSVQSEVKYGYDNNDSLILEEIEFYELDNTNKKIRSIYAYDDKHRLTDVYVEELLNNIWTKKSGGKYIFSDSGNVTTSVLNMYWDSNLSAYVNGARTDFNFDNKENLIKESGYYWISTDDTSYWKSQYTRENTYNSSNEISDYEIRYFTGNQNARYTNIVWYDYNKKLQASCTLQHWNIVRKQWQNFMRYTYSYPDSLTQIQLVEEWGNNTWYLVNRQTTIMSKDGEIDESANETPDSTGKWELRYQYKSFYLYDNGGRLFEKIKKNYNPNTKQLENNTRYTYEDYTEILSVHNETGIFTAIDIYPNPTQDVLNINMEMQKSNAIDIQLTDIWGRNIFSTKQHLNAGQNTFSTNIKQLKSGIYILKVGAEAGNIYTQKIVKTE